MKQVRLFGEALVAARQGQVLAAVQALVGWSEVFLAASLVAPQQVESQVLLRVGSLSRHQSLSDFVFQLAALRRGIFQVLWAPFLEAARAPDLALALALALARVPGQVLASSLVQALGL